MAPSQVPSLSSFSLSSLRNVYQALRGTNATYLTDRDFPGPTLRGKWIIISGANNGIGYEAAKSFAAWGANLILACRDPPEPELHPRLAVRHCTDVAISQGHQSLIEWWELDMADLRSVEAFCNRWLQTDRPLDILCNNAGIAGATDRHVTRDGFPIVHQVNFLSHVLMTLSLLPSLARSAQPRIICTTSCLHHLGVLDLDHFQGGADTKGSQYANNKLYYQIWIAEMQSRFFRHPQYQHITINGVNPGYVITGLWNSIEDNDTAAHVLRRFLMHLGISGQQGSLAITHAATSPELGASPRNQDGNAPVARVGGKYINRIWEAPAHYYCDDLHMRLQVWRKVDEELELYNKGLLAVLGR
ncbi:hypothetical protein BDV25DRAFT_119652 [Aspergillus avenaceus]|uniref:NAD(P)-binding protein n=1 Tax=Aspergillus avenaceus TaxID=36643 RepID=A0A5N6TUG1_ASPAV|nr:hypothetical protein BDV25DRAFT_119652 [Aspergillus avenaceus]